MGDDLTTQSAEQLNAVFESESAERQAFARGRPVLTTLPSQASIDPVWVDFTRKGQRWLRPWAL